MGQCYSFLFDCCVELKERRRQSSFFSDTQESIPLLQPTIPTSAPPAIANNTVKEVSASAPVPIVPVDRSSQMNGANSIFSKYEMREVIGVGSTSTCHKIVNKQHNKLFACKVIDKRQVDLKFSGLLDQFQMEIRVLKQLRHPNIIHLEDVYETNEKIYMVQLPTTLFDGYNKSR